jgi:hypothetical protein
MCKIQADSGNTTILLQYSAVTTTKMFFKIHSSYRLRGLTMLGTGVKGGHFSDVGSYWIWTFLVLSWALFEEITDLVFPFIYIS